MTATAPATPMGADRRPPALGMVVEAGGADEVLDAALELAVVAASVVEEALEVVLVRVVSEAVLVDPVVLETVAVDSDSVEEADSVDEGAEVDLAVLEAVALSLEV